MISMMAALVIGLLVTSAKQTYDSTNAAIVQGGARVIVLDRVLASYGPGAKEVREHLRQGLAATIRLLWPDERVEGILGIFERNTAMERVFQEIRSLEPQDRRQQALQEQAQKLCEELVLSRWVQIEQAQTSLPALFLAILLFWLTMLYMSFGLLAPRNPTVLAAMFIGALSLAPALFLILEMNRPMSGAIRISSAPMLKALEHLGR
jgi:hypothetical protein